MIDLFECPEQLPVSVRDIIARYLTDARKPEP